MQVLKTYYYLTKPGIIYANVMTAAAGYLFASKWHIRPVEFLATIIGTSLVIAGACVYNNCLDRNIDQKMARTARRSIATGDVSVRTGLTYATLLTLLGFLVLWWQVGWLVLWIGVVGFVDYVFAYGYAKRHTIYSTLVGSVSGSASIVAGYCAYRGELDAGAWLLFLILTLWQMPHFYAIGLYRQRDYSAAKLPVMPTQRAVRVVKLRIMAYIAAFAAAAALLTIRHYAGYSYLAVLMILSAGWFAYGIKNYGLPAKRWGKQMFLFSLLVNVGLSLAVAVGSVLA